MICSGISRETPVSSDDELASQSSIKCFSSWIQHGVGVGLEESLHLVEPLLAVARNPNLTETSLEALTHLLNHPETHRYPNLLMDMLNQLLSLKDHIQMLRYFVLRQTFISALLEMKNICDFLRREGDLEGAAHIYATLAAFGESHSRLLLDAVLEDGSKKENVLQLIQIMLESTGTPGRYPLDENCSHLAFSFW